MFYSYDRPWHFGLRPWYVLPTIQTKVPVAIPKSPF
jgi:hypothetical protein